MMTPTKVLNLETGKIETLDGTWAETIRCEVKQAHWDGELTRLQAEAIIARLGMAW